MWKENVNFESGKVCEHWVFLKEKEREVWLMNWRQSLSYLLRKRENVLARQKWEWVVCTKMEGFKKCNPSPFFQLCQLGALSLGRNGKVRRTWNLHDFRLEDRLPKEIAFKKLTSKEDDGIKKTISASKVAFGAKKSGWWSVYKRRKRNSSWKVGKASARARKWEVS